MGLLQHARKWGRDMVQGKGFSSAFATMIHDVKRWPSPTVQAEMFLAMATALRIGMINFHSIEDDSLPSLSLLAAVEKNFVELSYDTAANATQGARFTPRTLGLLRQNELHRLSSFDFLARFLPK